MRTLIAALAVCAFAWSATPAEAKGRHGHSHHGGGHRVDHSHAGHGKRDFIYGHKYYCDGTFTYCQLH